MTIQVEMKVAGSVMEAGNAGVDRTDAGGILFSNLDNDILNDIVKLGLQSFPSVSTFRMNKYFATFFIIGPVSSSNSSSIAAVLDLFAQG